MWWWCSKDNADSEKPTYVESCPFLLRTATSKAGFWVSKEIKTHRHSLRRRGANRQSNCGKCVLLALKPFTNTRLLDNLQYSPVEVLWLQGQRPWYIMGVFRLWSWQKLDPFFLILLMLVRGGIQLGARESEAGEASRLLPHHDH